MVVLVLIILTLLISILYLFNFEISSFSFPKIFKIKSSLEIFFSKKILTPSIVLSGELSPPRQ